MIKFVYCSTCGTPLLVTRKALPKYGRIIEIINQHVCSDTPIPLNLAPIEIPRTNEKDEKFIQNLNELTPPKEESLDLRDRRAPEFIKKESDSTAPKGLRSRLFGLMEPDDNG